MPSGTGITECTWTMFLCRTFLRMVASRLTLRWKSPYSKRLLANLAFCKYVTHSTTLIAWDQEGKNEEKNIRMVWSWWVKSLSFFGGRKNFLNLFVNWQDFLQPRKFITNGNLPRGEDGDDWWMFLVFLDLRSINWWLNNFKLIARGGDEHDATERE